MKISGPEKGILALTLVFLLLCVGSFFRSQGGGESYTVSAQTQWVREVGAVGTDPAQANTVQADAAETGTAEADAAETDSAEADVPETDGGEADGAEADAPETGVGEAGPAGGEGSEPEPKTAAGAEKININTATAEELQTLSGIGEVRAAAIIADREANGPFRIPEDITRVSGIGEGILAKILDYITVE